MATGTAMGMDMETAKGMDRRLYEYGTMIETTYKSGQTRVERFQTMVHLMRFCQTTEGDCELELAQKKVLTKGGA